jgi:hypothetical protein
VTNENIVERGWKLQVDHPAACVLLCERPPLVTGVAVGGSKAENKGLLIESALMTLDLFVQYRIGKIRVAMQNRKERIWKLYVLQVRIFE